MVSYFDSQVKHVLPMIGNEFQLSNERSKKMLGMEYRLDLKQSLIDMGYSLIEKGIVPDKRAKK